MTRSILICAALLLALIVSPAQASSLSLGDQDRMRSSSGWQEVQRQITPQEARAIALARVPGGEVVDIRRTSNAYRVRIIARNGQVVDIIVDAATGRVR